jgi:hypothetical protein
MGEALKIARRDAQEVSAMEMLEAIVYIIGFFTIWGAVVGMTWAIDNWVIRPILGRTLIDPEFWN